jgi:hypothetical protein
MAWLGLDWGNVPSWLSTAGVGIAAAVYWRDRRQKQRHQALSVGAWGSIEEPGIGATLADDARRVKLRIDAHNASDLPVHITQVGYRIHYSYGAVPSPESREVKEETRSAAGTSAMFSRTIPPKSTIELYSVVRRLDGPSLETSSVIYGPMHVSIVQLNLIDNAGTHWSIRPGGGNSGKRPVRIAQQWTPLEVRWFRS